MRSILFASSNGSAFILKTFCLVALLVVSSVSPVHSEVLKSVSFDSRWPEASPRNIAGSPSANVLFYANGKDLTLIHPETLVEYSRIEFEVTRGLAGICPDAAGKIVFVACGSKGLALVDISDPSAPVLLKKLVLDPDKETIHATAVAYLENRVYLADVYYGLRIIDVSNPLNPNQSGGYEQFSPYTDSDGKDSSFSGGHINVRVAEINNSKYAFVLDKYYGLRIFDVTIDSSPQLVGQYDMRSKYLYGQLSLVVDIAVDDKYAYVSDAEHGITILNLFSDGDHPERISITKKGQMETTGTTSGVSLAGNTLYVADGNNGLLITDVTDRSAPVTVSSYVAIGTYGITDMAGRLFIADTIDGITRIEKDGEANFVKTGAFEPPSNAESLFVDGNYAYLLDNSGPENGITIIALSNTGEYTYAGSVATPGNANNLHVSKSRAYVADGTAGVSIIDLEELTSPVIAGSFNPGGNASDIIIHGFDNTAYIADKSFGLVLADITEQGTLVEKSTLHIENARAIAFSSQEKNYILTVNEDGLYTVDVSNPATPVLTGYLKTQGQALDVGVKDHYAVVADGDNGIVLIDISDAANPVLAASYDTEGNAQALYLDQSYIHVADGSNGLLILGISVDSQPPEIKEIVHYNTPGNASGTFVRGSGLKSYTYVADGKGGFLSFLHSEQSSGGIDEQPFPDNPDDTGWDRAEGGPSCFISILL